ncbi:hypothetical protein NERG_00852 [Nematocida ausubeli]|uniref:Uncharacterized protein n=1 Tax=Nematocida ausubeli (strain ATCC PRA-371 / ERTm2) TaxID=1913371 RepID=H8ZBA3_NEMA1|nr:hypothetical protein NERG_00852 [Nematocida ausubeli]
METHQSNRKLSNHLSLINSVASGVGIATTVYGNLDVACNNYFNVDLAINPKKFFFVTNSTLLFSFFAFCMSITVPYISNNKMHTLSAHLTSTILTAELLISIIFWPIFRYNPNLVFPKSSIYGPRRISMFANLCMHAFPCVLLFITYIANKATHKPSIAWSALYISYIVTISYIYYYTYGHWRYRIMDKISSYVPLFFVFLGVLFWITHRKLYWIKVKVYSHYQIDKW